MASRPRYLLYVFLLILVTVFAAALYNYQGISYPTETRYANLYSLNSSPEWNPESQVDLNQIDPTGIIEVTRYPGAEPEQEQLEEAWKLYDRSYRAAEANSWFDIDNARDDGFSYWGTVHFMNMEYRMSNEILNPDRPESLVYYVDPDNSSNRILAGYMYMTSNLSQVGPQVGGPLTVWHYHVREKPHCVGSLNSFGASFEGSECSGSDMMKNRTLEMMHVWFIKHPEGQFASTMALPEGYIKQPEKMDREEFFEHLERTRNSDWVNVSGENAYDKSTDKMIESFDNQE